MAVANQDALDTYRAMFAAMQSRGLEPMLTLHHYTTPTWIHDGLSCHEDLASCTDRGWLDEERVVRELAKYAVFVAREFDASVDLWATQNEPFAVVLSAFLQPSQTRSCDFSQRRYGLPIYITENNGQALWKEDVELEQRYVVENLRWVCRSAARYACSSKPNARACSMNFVSSGATKKN